MFPITLTKLMKNTNYKAHHVTFSIPITSSFFGSKYFPQQCVLKHWQPSFFLYSENPKGHSPRFVRDVLPKHNVHWHMVETVVWTYTSCLPLELYVQITLHEWTAKQMLMLVSKHGLLKEKHKKCMQWNNERTGTRSQPPTDTQKCRLQWSVCHMNG
jgi:hypothetical protein